MGLTIRVHEKSLGSSSINLYRASDSAYNTISPYPWAWFATSMEYAKSYADAESSKSYVVKPYAVAKKDLSIADPYTMKKVLLSKGISTFGDNVDLDDDDLGDWNLYEFGYGNNDKEVADALLDAGYNAFYFVDGDFNEKVYCILDLSIVKPVKG